MPLTSIGDLAQSHLLRLNNTRLKSALDGLTGELGSGRKADIGKAVRGDFRPLAALDRSIGLLDRFQQSVSEARLRAGTIQTLLGGLQEASDRSAGALTTAGTHGGGRNWPSRRAPRGEISLPPSRRSTPALQARRFSPVWPRTVRRCRMPAPCWPNSAR
ncbi:hypothetical protein DDZ14_04400 [Maritimibacter sp. 55A14]|uniref:hypothetical protein n=1 Tax=Maritimibacter sp. 55A14 TaxID=2174844 RepID=UPI000D60F51A|nr:hypothetical protein [Maritimibacter sp. 55A14]PWE33444.1 hypothetical protein DDZ14_04400 [Maritimibacter sp. 55A14]